MSEITVQSQSTAFKIGWWILVALSVVSVLGHAALLFAEPGEEILFLGWVAFPFFALVVLFIPYRRGERWAWAVTWVMVLAFALVPLFSAEIGLYYLAIAGLLALGQLLTGSALFSKQ